ncbi:hypothetical protein HMEPL2_26320 [Vreelandella aquamarina]|jgi:hypothetical protein|uniref:Uncharacterized protein n=2 Tax=Vreelandella aquamarina TaxID=77097 RepID=A0A6F8XD14_9GAMM|nr:hypothetical protein HMEPL2_26320 [Halomonas meridiana]
MCTVWQKPTRPSLTIVSKLGVSEFVFDFVGCAALKSFFAMLQHTAATFEGGGGGISKMNTAELTGIAN